MNIKRLAIAMGVFMLPLLLRTMWFYRGFYIPSSGDNSPDFSEFSVIQPPLSTAPAFSAVNSASGKRILFDLAHRNTFTLGEIGTLRNELLQQGADILELYPKDDLEDSLKKADAFVIITPTDFFSPADLEAVENFIDRGGRLLVIADPTRSFSEYDNEREESVILANEILETFRISFRNDYVYSLSNNEGNYRNVFIKPTVSHPLTNGVSQLVFYAAHSLTTLNEVILSAEESVLSSLDDQGTQLPVAALDQSGNVLVIGDLTFMSTPYNQVADNHRLIINISKFLLTGERDRTLADFPDLFRQPVAIRLSEGISLDEDLIAVIADLKQNLAFDDLPLMILDTEEAGIDQIYIGTYPPNEDLRVFTDTFGIVFGISQPMPTQTPVPEATSEPESNISADVLSNRSFFIPGFGEIPSEGFGFLLLEQKGGQTNLIILADSQENATNLLHLLVTGNLDICLVNDQIAVCQQDAVSSQLFEEESAPEIPDELIEEMDTPVPTTTTPDDSPTETPSP
jgi:hypothetical protein